MRRTHIHPLKTLGAAVSGAALVSAASGQCIINRPLTIPPYTFAECSSTTFPNDFPVCAARPINMIAGDSISGAAGVQNPILNSCTPYAPANEPATIDYWRPKLKPGPTSEWICCTITITNPVAQVETEAYGLRQINGTVQLGDYTVIGTSEASQDGKTIRFCYNNKDYQPLFTVGGSLTPGVPYQGTMECAPAQGIPSPGGTTSGPINLRAAPGNFADIDMVVCDSELNPIPGYLHDDPDDSGFTRDYPPGEYWIALSDHDLVSNLASDVPDEQFRDGAVLESLHGVACSSPALVPNLSIVITDSVGSYMVPVSKTEAYGVAFVRMVVRPPGVSHAPGGVGLATPQVVQTCGGESVLLEIQGTAGGFPPAPVAGIDMDLSALGVPAPTQLFDDGSHGDRFANDGVYSVRAPVVPGIPPRDVFLPFTVHDALGRSSTSAVFMTIAACSPCPVCAADFNEDGGIDGADVSAFYEAWENGTACGDANGDGGIDGGDVEHFFAVWENGGC